VAGRPDKGSFDLAKLEPAIRGTPVVESYHARVFAPVSRTAFGKNQKFMKPIHQISPAQHARQSFPSTDYNFQATVDAKASSAAVRPATKSPAFHKISSEFFGAETSREYIAELLFFILITGISAWPIMLAVVAIIRLIRNY
jgi:hypothetical protein